MILTKEIKQKLDALVEQIYTAGQQLNSLTEESNTEAILCEPSLCSEELGNALLNLATLQRDLKNLAHKEYTDKLVEKLEAFSLSGLHPANPVSFAGFLEYAGLPATHHTRQQAELYYAHLLRSLCAEGPTQFDWKRTVVSVLYRRDLGRTEFKFQPMGQSIPKGWEWRGAMFIESPREVEDVFGEEERDYKETPSDAVHLARCLNKHLAPILANAANTVVEEDKK